jgi:hypothetical protein
VWLAETDRIMSRHAGLLEKRVEVLYRAGDIHLPVTATLVADSGKSIFLEERILHNKKVKTFRWEIPYPCILRIQELAAAPEQDAAGVEAEALGLEESSEKA